MRRTVAVVMLVLSFAALSGCSAPANTPSTGGASGAAPAGIVSERCTRCHPIDRIRAAQHDASAWTATVTRMRGKGAQLSDVEARQVIDFLAGGGAAGL